MSGHISGTGGAPGVETDEPKSRRIWFYIAGFLTFLAVFQVSAYLWFLGMKDAELQAKEVYSQDQDLQAQRRKEAQALEGFQWVDKENGKVRIPISRAMELLLKEQAK